MKVVIFYPDGEYPGQMDYKNAILIAYGANGNVTLPLDIHKGQQCIYLKPESEEGMTAVVCRDCKGEGVKRTVVGGTGKISSSRCNSCMGRGKVRINIDELEIEGS